MSALIPGFEYDIFVSYRHKDNKYDGWVTEFVANLRKELEATFKEDVSIYFDENPHDGLLETHRVDKSLEGKLKCLIFIPILSQTYCDPKSFAWNNEFIAFRDLAKEDQFGLDIKLLNGNVANRILPIRIHELEAGDKSLFEDETGGVLRSIDFIFKVAGVNRPLRAKDDDLKEIAHATFYRDQINKVANGVKEIISCLAFGLKYPISKHEYSPRALQDYREPISDSLTSNSTDEISSKSILKIPARSNRVIVVLSLLVFVFGMLAIWGWLREDPDSFKRLATYSTIPLEPLTMDISGQFPRFTISPDGRTIAYSSEKGIIVRSLSGFSSRVLEGTERATFVVFSPDGQSLAFSKDSQIHKISLTGSPKSIVYASGVGGGMSWGIDGNIYFSAALGTGGIWRVSANGGEPEQLTFVNDSLGENAHTWPQLLPDSKTLLFTALGPSGGQLDSRVVIQQLNSNERKVLFEKAVSGRYLLNGHILYAYNDGTIFAHRFDLAKLSTTGEPTAVLTGVTTASWGGAAFISVSETGDLIFLPRSDLPLNVLDVVDRSGKLIPSDSISPTVLARMGHAWSGVLISPSGDFIAISGRSYGSSDIWLLNLKTMDTERITFDLSEDEFPVWSPDGNSIAYTSAQTGNTRRLFIKGLASGAKPRLIRTWPRHIHFSSWSPDGKWLAAYDVSPTQGNDCWAISAESMDSIPIAIGSANESNAVISPDGRWLAFQSDESGRNEIYVVSFPNPANKRQISIDGGTIPRWDPTGKVIYYLSKGYLIAQPVETSHDFMRGKPNPMFPTKAFAYSISPDGQKFYIIRRNTKENTPLYLITNWFQELKTKISK